MFHTSNDPTSERLNWASIFSVSLVTWVDINLLCIFTIGTLLVINRKKTFIMFFIGYDLKVSVPTLLNSCYDLAHKDDLPGTFNLSIYF